ncbi:MAG: 4-hydroxybenzoate octaprenyltransferase [Planctomycetaceae bacterium]|mgnify:CR=1 FL=1|nr:putative 4-hydroxybenzoate polyprenyltransferase [Planctomycetales bacterium]MCB9875598.1 4-hydroxybenzoate octaprenyltransferase [Planctomycetaceae bacterium]MCB9941677.1 4-hydroxybenzoate octaprenyltransferase [Planctomycetaceae bacterium]HRX78470.1 4-hydroxybenzoate octaprenyltransferase [Pirellulaceae bacterium]
MITRLRHILEMIRFSHTIFALPFALLATVMAWTTPSPSLSPHLPPSPPPFNWLHLLGILLCMVFARSAAMAFNRIADREVDAENPRTATRHIPAGALSVGSVVIFTLFSSLGFIGSTLLFLPNPLPIVLSVPVLGFLMAYSYTKRITSMAQFWLGASLMLAPVCAWIALRGEMLLENPADILPAVCLGAGVLMWVAGFDMIYACQDYEFDVKAKLRSIPTAMGIAGALRLAAVCHCAMILVFLALPFTHLVGGPVLDLGWIYWTAIAGIALLLVYEHRLVRPDDLTRVNVAFFNVNAIVSMGLFVATAIDLLTSF